MSGVFVDGLQAADIDIERLGEIRLHTSVYLGIANFCASGFRRWSQHQNV